MLQQWFRSVARGIRNAVKGSRTKASRPSARLQVEQMEERALPAAISVAAYTTALISQIHTDATKLVQDAATIETQHPTLLRNQIVSDVAAVKNDVTAGNIATIFTAVGKLQSDLTYESSLSKAFRLPAQASLANYSAIQTDYSRLVADQQAANQFVVYLEQAKQPVQPAKPAVTSGSTQVYNDLSAMGLWGGMTPQQNPSLQGLIQSIPQSAWTTDPSVIAMNQWVDGLLGAKA